MRYRAIIAATAATLTGLATMAVTTTTAGAAPMALTLGRLR